MAKIMLDPGHGGKDGGAQGNGLSEKELTLSIAQKTKNILENNFENATVYMTRSGDQYLTLSERANEANRKDVDLFVSIHINSAAGTAGDGFESYIYNGTVGDSTKAAHNVLHAAVMRTGLFKDRGKKRANFGVLRETKMDALLTENGFINNPSNAKILKQADTLNKLAEAHAVGIAEILGLKRKPTKAPTARKLYKVQTGAFEDKENAERLAAELESKGYKTFIVEE